MNRFGLHWMFAKACVVKVISRNLDPVCQRCYKGKSLGNYLFG